MAAMPNRDRNLFMTSVHVQEINQHVTAHGSNVHSSGLNSNGHRLWTWRQQHAPNIHYSHHLCNTV